MNKSEEDYSDPQRVSNSSITPHLLGFSGLAISVGGYIAVMLLSGTSGWWTPTYIAALLICGAAGIGLGIMTVIRAGKLTRGRIAARILGIISAAAGGIILGIVGSLLILMLLLSSSSR
jgi:hypothetical protein